MLALTLQGSAGADLRIDYINAQGPTNAWDGLVTVTLTNPPQLYLDISAFGRPPRLNRLTPVP